MLDKLFKFPIVMVDGNKEEEKEQRRKNLSLDEPSDADMIIGEAECPYYDFVSVTDRWLPTEDSYENATHGKFDACSVYFAQSGTFVVPWNKEKFKKQMKAFVDKLPTDKKDDKSQIRIMTFTKEGLQDALNELPDDENDQDG